MQADYKRDMSHSYLILKEEREFDTASYQIRMLVGNPISSLLPCTMKGMNGDILFYYDITSRQSMHVRYEKQKLGFEALTGLWEGVLLGLGQVEEYLLDPDDLVLLPEYLYLENDGAKLCYLPGYQKDIWEQLRRFSEYLLPKIAHEDARAVALGYGMYRLVMEEGISVERIKEELYHPRMEEWMREEKAASSVEAASFEQFRQEREQEAVKREAMEAFFAEEPERVRSGKQRFSVALGVVGLAGTVGYLVWQGWVSWVLALLLGVAMAAAGGISCLFKWKRQRTEGKEEEVALPPPELERELWEEYREEYQEEYQRQLALQKEKNQEAQTGETTVLYQARDGGVSSLVSKTPGKYPAIFLEQEMTVVGKLEAACDAVLEEETISRVHARICRKEEGFYLTDLNSRNGTCVNGKILQGEEEYLLQDQDVVSFAQVQYIFLK